MDELTKRPSPEQAMQQAIERAGGKYALGRALGIRGQSILDWKRVPAKWCLAVEALTDLSREVLRPDIYPPGSTKRPKRPYALR